MLDDLSKLVKLVNGWAWIWSQDLLALKSRRFFLYHTASHNFYEIWFISLYY